MRQAVRDAFVGYSAPLEGVVPHLYADIKGLVTIAIGNLVDPVATALALPMRHADGSIASKEDIRADWNRVKSDPRCATQGWRYAARIAQLHLDEDGIAQVVGAKLELFDRQMVARFANYSEWCADAQLAILSHCWACGGAWRFPMLERALRVLDWPTAAVECQMNTTGNPGLIPRVSSQRLLFANAAIIDRDGLDPDMLYWPRDLRSESEDGPVV